MNKKARDILLGSSGLGKTEAEEIEKKYIKSREQKAKMALAVLKDFFSKNVKDLSLLDIGCSVGIIPNYLSEEFKSAVGMDVDKEAVAYAKKKWQRPNLSFMYGDGQKTGFQRESFNVIICHAIYEHVDDSQELLDEIWRLLKFNGVCYFTAMNKISLIEPHYRLPLLSCLPHPLSDSYVRLFGKDTHFPIKSLTLKNLSKLVSKFERIDYTVKAMENPKAFEVGKLVPHGSIKQKLAVFVGKFFYGLVPTYIWLLQKK